MNYNRNKNSVIVSKYFTFNKYLDLIKVPSFNICFSQVIFVNDE